MNNTEIHIMPSMNPDGFESSFTNLELPSCKSLFGRTNSNLLDLNRNFPTWNDFKVCYPLVKSKYSLRNLMELLKKDHEGNLIELEGTLF